MRFRYAGPSMGAGPIRWQVSAGRLDRWRYTAQRALFAAARPARLRGAARASRALRRVVGDYAAPLEASSGSDLTVYFDGFDPYWMCVFFRNDVYEPELHNLFESIRTPRRFAFIDGGANIGYWSAVLTSSRFGFHRAIAVEPSPPTAALLRRTAQRAGGRIDLVTKAVSSTPAPVWFSSSLNHESRKILDQPDPDDRGERTDGVTIDALVSEYALDPSNLIVKLDIEGAEIAAFEGALRALDDGAIFVYEDHGKDPTCRVTAHLLRTGVRCWFVADDGELQEMNSPEEVAVRKIDPIRGYNLVAVRREYDDRSPIVVRLAAT